MRAWQVTRYGTPSESLEQVDVSEPSPGSEEIRLRVHAAALGLPDAFMCGGTYGFSPSMPFIPGEEVCGTVVELGSSVSGFTVGQRVMGVTSFPEGHGGFAEQTLARAGSCFRVPDDMTDVDAAGFRIGYSTAWIGLVRRGELREGQQLLVLGAAGGSGAAAVQLGAMLGARVIAPEGTFLFVGHASGGFLEPSIPRLGTRNYSLVGVYAGRYTPEQNEAD